MEEGVALLLALPHKVPILEELFFGAVPFEVASYLGWLEAEGGGLDVRLVFVRQEEGAVVQQTQVLPCGHVS